MRPDYIDPLVGIPLAVVLWTIVLILFLVDRRRKKVKLAKEHRIIREAARREEYIRQTNKQDDEMFPDFSYPDMDSK